MLLLAKYEFSSFIILVIFALFSPSLDDLFFAFFFFFLSFLESFISESLIFDKLSSSSIAFLIMFLTLISISFSRFEIYDF